MNKEENKTLLENFIKSNPFDFKQGIISHCKQLDKADVYEWIAEDELKIQQLQINWNELKKWLKEKEQEYKKDCYAGEYGFVIGFIMVILDKMTELKRGEE